MNTLKTDEILKEVLALNTIDTIRQNNLKGHIPAEVSKNLYEIFPHDYADEVTKLATNARKRKLKNQFVGEDFNFVDNDDVIEYINNLIDNYLVIGDPFETYEDNVQRVWDIIEQDILSYFDVTDKKDSESIVDWLRNVDSEFFNMILNEMVHNLDWRENTNLANEFKLMCETYGIEADLYIPKKEIVKEEITDTVSRIISMNNYALSNNCLYSITTFNDKNNIQVVVVETNSVSNLKEYVILSDVDAINVAGLLPKEIFVTETFAITRLA